MTRIATVCALFVCVSSTSPLAVAQFDKLGGAWDKVSKSVTDTAKDIGEKGAEVFEGPSPDEQRAELQTARSNALAKLYEQEATMTSVLEDAKGYAVFSNIGVNLFLISTQRGGGILHDNASSEDTYMQMFSAGGGIGLGVKDFAAIFVFHTESAMQQFVTEGWDFSGQADAGAKVEEEGDGVEMAVSAMPGTSLYQLTASGVSAQVTLQGTKFWKDEDLN